jgi:hypothetical protein
VLVAKIDVTANANDAFLNACMYVLIKGLMNVFSGYFVLIIVRKNRAQYSLFLS